MKLLKNILVKIQQDWILCLILLLAAVLRFNNYSNLSITVDEVSALLRLRFDNFKDLIDIGVRPDGHPAGVQVFLYFWTKVFGISEASIRFPFVIAGILSVLFTYLIGYTWFNKNAGLFSAASICFLQFPLLYSQIARPYSPGLMFTLMSTWMWTLVLFKPKPYTSLKVIGYTLSTSMAIYCHYFSYFQVMLIGITGLFLINRYNYKRYILSGVLVFLLFLPHFSISLGHIQYTGGIISWVPSPDEEENWFGKYLLFCFNDSMPLLILYMLVFIISMTITGREKSHAKLRILALLWFIVPFLVGYYYSVYVTPVLQRSVLLFSFPFLLLLLFSFVPCPFERINIKYIIIPFLTIGLLSTTVVNGFYKSHSFGVLKELVETAIRIEDKYGADNISKTINILKPYFIEYYLEKYGREINYITYHTDNHIDKYRNDGREELQNFKDIVTRSKTKYFLYQWSGKYSPNEIPEIIKEKYPYLVERELYFNSETYLFSKDKNDKTISDDYLYVSNYNFESSSPDWVGIESFLSSETAYSGAYSEVLSKDHEFSHRFQKRIGILFKTKENNIHVSVMGNFKEAGSEANLVITLEDPSGKAYDWSGMNFSYFVKNPGEWKKVYHSKRFHDIRSAEDVIKIYVWNSGGKPTYIDDIRITVSEGNPLLYGKPDISL